MNNPERLSLSNSSSPTPVPTTGGGATVNEDPTPIRGPVKPKPNAAPDEPTPNGEQGDTPIAV